MTDGQGFIFFEIRLTIIAGYAGILPEPELILWLRAVTNHPAKVLLVQPVEPLRAAEGRTRRYVATEMTLDSDRLGNIVHGLRSIGFPGQLPETYDTSDPETIWWVHIAFEVRIDDKSGIVNLSIGPRGIAGRDASGLQGILRELWAGVGVDSPWSDVLGLRTWSDESTA